MPRGMPQIEITYEVDANGILQVSAVEKSTGKSEKITISNASNKLTKEQIEKMVQEAEQFKEQDEAIARKVEAKNKLEGYVYNVKSSVLGDEKMKTSIGAEVDTVQNTIDEAIKWLDDSAERTQEDYEAKQKEVEGVLSPLIQKGYQANMPAGVPPPQETPSGPAVEEVD